MIRQGQAVLVIGLGESGLAMAKWLHRQGARVRVADTRATLSPSQVDALQAVAPGAVLSLGALQPGLFAGMDLVCLSPGVPKALLDSFTVDVPIVSEIELFAAAVRAQVPTSRILAITGSNGKTTTTALTAHLLNGAGVPAIACGNISPAALNALMDAQDAEALPAVWVLELSSFQLETTHHLHATAATVLNVSEDHLDRYEGSMALYAAAKGRIFQGKGLMILNRQDDWSMANGRCGRSMVTFGLDRPPRSSDFGFADGMLWQGSTALLSWADAPLRGQHNAANILAALALCQAVGVAPAQAVQALSGFRGLPHRVELVGSKRGVSYIDDSKGTNVGATLAAIEGMGCPVALILGGDGKGQDFTPLAAAVQQHARAVALIGRDAVRIEAVLAGTEVPLQHCADMTEAVHWLAGLAQAGDCVLLSPACASLDMYRNYAHRAEAFVTAVEALPT